MGQITELMNEIHANNVEKGWWPDPEQPVRETLQKSSFRFDPQTIDQVVGSLRVNGHLKNPTRETLAHLMLIVTELAEAAEEVRVGSHPLYVNVKESDDAIVQVTPQDPAWERFKHLKPEGLLSEIADVMIRCMDLCGRYEWDLEGTIKQKMEYNKTRSFRHGGKLA